MGEDKVGWGGVEWKWEVETKDVGEGAGAEIGRAGVREKMMEHTTTTTPSQSPAPKPSPHPS